MDLLHGGISNQQVLRVGWCYRFRPLPTPHFLPTARGGGDKQPGESEGRHEDRRASVPTAEERAESNINDDALSAQDASNPYNPLHPSCANCDVCADAQRDPHDALKTNALSRRYNCRQGGRCGRACLFRFCQWTSIRIYMYLFFEGPMTGCVEEDGKTEIYTQRSPCIVTSDNCVVLPTLFVLVRNRSSLLRACTQDNLCLCVIA